MKPRAKNPNVVALAQRLLGVNLTRLQRRILRAVMRARRLAVATCHGVGKSYALAVLAITFVLMYEDARVLIITPGWLMNRAVIWSEIFSILQRSKNKLPILSQTQTELRLGPRNLVIGLSASDPLRLQGHHSEHLLVIIDEVAAIDPNYFPAVEGLLAAGDAHLIISGNPTTTSGPFYDAFGRNRSNWECIQIGAFDTDNFEGVTLEGLLGMSEVQLDANPVPFLIGRRWVRERYREWFNGGIENSPLWASRVLGIFPTSSINALLPLAALETARRAAFDRGGDVIIGVDPAGSGRDRTVCTAVDGGAILETGVYTDTDAWGRVLQFIQKWHKRLRLVRVDSNGVGFGLCENIRHAGFPCVGLNAGSGSAEPERFKNLKAERYWHLRERFIMGEISGLSDGALSELAAIDYAIDPAGKTVIEDKKGSGKSPDLAESLMLAAGELPPQPYAYTPVGQYLSNGRSPLTYPTPQIEPTGEEVARLEDFGGNANVRFGALGGRLRFTRCGSW